ncbi:MAG TPA: esterase-like activity of phytase family protein, partial [Candidatus Sulfomarinibacteraceae bacterium]|nr:esterase-like activity of phytase family protein [Candidatus Sulfomarinibacteraceae bacterium]
WDGEGLALAPTGGFYVADEASSQVLVLDESGSVEDTVELPAHVADARRNRSLESLSLSPDGRFLFTMNEDALPADGPPADTDRGAVLRLLRVDLASGRHTERAYLTDPIFTAGRGNLGVSDIAALSETRLVVMERAWVKGVGNSVRLFTVDLADTPDVLGEPSLNGTAHALPKRLLLDLAALPDSPFPERPEEPQAARALANYEGLALGPAFDDGTRLLFLQSDDNARSTQVSRLLVLRGPVP